MSAGTPFQRFAATCAKLRHEPARTPKLQIVQEFLRRVDEHEVASAARFLVGHPLAQASQDGLHVGWTQLEAAAGPPQRGPPQDPLTISEAAAGFVEIASMHGVGSVQRRQARLAGLLARVPGAGRPWFEGLVMGEMRHGVNEGLVLEAVARAADCPIDLVRRALMLRGDLGEVAAIALKEGEAGLRGVRLRLFQPVRVMMAETAIDLGDALRRLGTACALEYKFDGARVVIHKQGDEVRVQSRRLTDVTQSVPEIVEAARLLEADECVVEGEAIGYDQGGRPMPFQDLMRRFRRVNDVASMARRVRLRVHLFDLLQLDGHSLLDAPNRERWQVLSSIAPARLLAPRLVTGSLEGARRFFEQALAAGHEGVVAKDLASPYVLGRRGAHWLKVKQSKTLDVAIIGAEWGTGRRTNWLSNYHLAARVAPPDEPLLRAPVDAARSPHAHREGFAMIGKTFKGPTDQLFEELTQRLMQIADHREPWGVSVPPSIVVEVEYRDLQQSPRYEAGLALRFARIKRVRDDKEPREADTLGTLHRLAGSKRTRLAAPRRAHAPSTVAS
jgi:DNA ligase-1